MNISNESIISLRNAIDNIIKQLIRTPDSSQDWDFRTEHIDHISDFGEVLDKIIERYSTHIVMVSDLTPNRRLLLCLYYFYQEVFEKEEPFNEDSRTRLELKRILN